MKVKRAELLATLEKVKPALAAGGSVPELSHIWFTGKEVLAFDGGLGIRVPYESDIHFGLPGQPLLALLRSTTAEEIDFDPGKKAGVDLKLGSGRATLTTLDAGRSPWTYNDEEEITGSFEITEDVLNGLRRALLISVSKPTRVEHYGVVLFPIKEGLAMFTTDDAMMIRVMVKVAAKADELEAFRKVILPRGFVQQVISQCAPGASLVLAKNYIYASGEGVEIFSNVLDNKAVHDLPSVITAHKDAGTRIALPPGFGSALQRARILASGDEAKVMVAVDGDGMSIKGKYKHGRLDEELMLTGDASQAEIRLVANKLAGLTEATDFAMDNDVFLLYGGDDFIFLVSAQDDE